MSAMQKNGLENSLRVVMPPPSPTEGAPPTREHSPSRPLPPIGPYAPEPLAEEVTINGHRYRLVSDLDEIGHPPRPVAVPPCSPVELLTARETQIVMLVADGMVNKQIAAALQISEWTVSTHLRRIFAKLNVDTRAAMVTRCVAVLSSARPTR